jgi:hypothetical protein
MFDQPITSIVSTLKHVSERPKLYVGADLLSIKNFLDGFNLACTALGLAAQREKYLNEIIVLRGWRLSASLIHEMKERGLDEEQIAQEFLAIHVQVWEKLQEIEQVQPQTT